MTYNIHPEETFESAISCHVELVGELRRQRQEFEAIATTMISTLEKSGKILWCGNGGSAADAQHLAAEIVGRFRRDRRGLPSIALTTDSSVLTAVANDYGYDHVFSRQVEALAHPGDALVGISTSGNSRNVVAALVQAKAMGVTTIALTGLGGGKMGEIADYVLSVPATDTARIQEIHILIGHMLCGWLEREWLRSSQADSAESRIETL